jgi:hypothetical protein
MGLFNGVTSTQHTKYPPTRYQDGTYLTLTTNTDVSTNCSHNNIATNYWYLTGTPELTYQLLKCVSVKPSSGGRITL